MNIQQVIGNRPDTMSIRIFNIDTVTLPILTPAYFSFVSGAPVSVNGQPTDGMNVMRPSAALAAGYGIMAGMIVTPGGIPPNSFGDAAVLGVIANVPVIVNTRATVGTAYGAQAAVNAGTGLSVDTTNNYLTALTTITKTQSNIAPAITLDNIAANIGQGTTPASGLFLTTTVRILIPWF